VFLQSFISLRSISLFRKPRGKEFGRCKSSTAKIPPLNEAGEFSPAAMITPSMVVGENSNNGDDWVYVFDF
jgi:hypothetical protein